MVDTASIGSFVPIGINRPPSGPCVPEIFRNRKLLTGSSGTTKTSPGEISLAAPISEARPWRLRSGNCPPGTWQAPLTAQLLAKTRAAGVTSSQPSGMAASGPGGRSGAIVSQPNEPTKHHTSSASRRANEL